MSEEYAVRPIQMFASGTNEPDGYVPMIVRERDGCILEFAVPDGNNTGNWQPRHQTPEAAMAYYAACPESAMVAGPYAHLLRIPTDEVRAHIDELLGVREETPEELDSTAPAVEENQTLS